jgi:hypothetical protein
MPPDSVIYYLVSLLVAKMFELKEELYQEQVVSIFEFTLLINGIIVFKDFHKYSQYYLGFINNFLRQEMDENYKFLMVTDLADIELEEQLDTKTPAEREKILRDMNEKEISIYCPEMINRLEQLSYEEKVKIHSMFKFLNKSEEQHYNGFPNKIVSVEPLFDVYNDAYKLGELLNWLTSNFDLDKPHGLPLAEWVRNLLSPPETLHQENVSTYDGYIKIDTLPKRMQFMIECYDDKSLQRTTLDNRDKKKDVYITDMHNKLDPLAIKQGITYTNKNKNIKGLSKAAVEQMMLCILEDKNN